jgi:hypothetical protein
MENRKMFPPCSPVLETLQTQNLLSLAMELLPWKIKVNSENIEEEQNSDYKYNHQTTT